VYAAFAKLGGDFSARVVIDIQYNDRLFLFSQSVGDGLTDATGSSGYNGNFAHRVLLRINQTFHYRVRWLCVNTNPRRGGVGARFIAPFLTSGIGRNKLRPYTGIPQITPSLTSDLATAKNAFGNDGLEIHNYAASYEEINLSRLKPDSDAGLATPYPAWPLPTR
jgi:hypothetical protein